MPPRLDKLDPLLARLDNLLAGMPLSPSSKTVVERWRSDAAALRFHLRPRPKDQPLLAAVIGGTGTGKSTIVNRLLGVSASATSFRRTFTGGAVAVAREAGDVPGGWLGVEHVIATPDRLPARGQAGALVIVPRAALAEAPAHEELLSSVVLIDTPDPDGDQPAHHAEADRVFRWAQAIVFLVTPEKYQMTELLPYYRLAARYGLPALFVMNKCEEQAVAEDYREQLMGAGFGGQGSGEEAEDAGTGRRGDAGTEDIGGETAGRESIFPASPRPRVPVSSSPLASLFIVPRDDAGYDAPQNENLSALRTALAELSTQ
ncbi:MAG: superfamily binding cassette transporter, partial [Massilia sp.]|nr:superfamily binding cassette transporter [Massilia sp.]